MQLKPGTKLQSGKYEIVRTLGQGGFGITYEAFHTSFERKVAVKEFFMKDICNREMETSHVSVPSVGSKELVDKFKKKFIKEAKTIVALDHPNIVRVTDVFEENGTAYYVMNNLSGGSLADKVKKEGPLTEAQAEKYIRQVADALAYIHERNTVHLDVKPSNILLNAKGDAVLIDFGISKHYDKAGEQTSSTPVGISKGYAPMEQGRDGDVSQFGPSTDIYALGATLYHLVSGHVPPEASIVVEEGLDRPQGVSDKIWNLIERSMQPKRKDRPQSIAEFLQLFDEAPAPKKEDDETVAAIKKSPAKYPNKKSVDAEKKASKTWLWAVLGVVAVVAIVLVVVLGKKRPAEDVSPAPVKDTVETVVTPEPAKQPETVVKERPAPIQQQPARQQTQAPSKTGSDNGHEWVDLGLPSGTKWATCNVGASIPSGYGNYYAWGETITKSTYCWENYHFRTSGDNYDNVRFSKYNTESACGTVDNILQLDLGDDAARANWGGKWRIPTKSQWEELESHCTWSWTGSGYMVTGPNGHSITLPAAGFRSGSSSYDVASFGDYWSSSLHTKYPYLAWLVILYSEGHDVSYMNERIDGLSVRPVTE